MNILVVGAGGVGASMASIAETRGFFDSFVLADISRERAEQAVAELDDPGKFSAETVDAGDVKALIALITRTKADIVINACDPRFNESIFEACFTAKCNYLDMAMSLSEPHETDPTRKAGLKLGDQQYALNDQWERAGLLALVGIGVEPGLSNIFARYAADHLFSEIDEISVKDGGNLIVRDENGNEIFAPSFSIWTTIEECLNPPLMWEASKGWYTTPAFSEPEIFEFPDGIGAVECVNVEHEEVSMLPRTMNAKKYSFKYGLGTDFINVLKTLNLLGLDRTKPVRVRSACRRGKLCASS